MNPKNKIDRRKVYVSSYFPVTANFAGEATPLKISDVKERLDRELIVNIKSCVHHFSNKRANRLLLLLNLFLKNESDDFAGLAVIGGLVNAVSGAGARGVWQFMPETARKEGWK
jgi:hypothetical protein